jgi:hypothetical protein
VGTDLAADLSNTFDLGYPNGWIPMEPADGTIAVVVAPNATNGFFANLVVTLSAAPPEPHASLIDDYLLGTVSGLIEALTEPSIEAVWVTESHCPHPQQRLIVRHVVEGIEVEMVQHHAWRRDGIVIISASMAINPAADLIEALDVCLLSAADDKTVTFIDWEPADMAMPWSPSVDAERIAHL